MTPSRVRSVFATCAMGALAGWAGFAGGCSRHADEGAMGVLSAQGPERPLVLGAGDALGVQIYVNDCLIAARELERRSAVAMGGE